jgi:dTDP-4-dehydrorhamnose reductase
MRKIACDDSIECAEKSEDKEMKVLVLGANGMLGRTMLKVLAQRADWQVSGSIRAKIFDGIAPGAVMTGIDLSSPDHLARLFSKIKPNVVINCAGLIKHLPEGNDPITALTVNALLPHRLAEYCAMTGARLIHVSTDCVFSGATGNYLETDITDAMDIYGKTKALGEVAGVDTVTLRTSIIGHEHGTSFGLLEWFLAQCHCKGFRRAIFSGLPTVEFSRIVRDIVIHDTSLNGIYHVGAAPIDKFSLLQIIAKIYKRNTIITADSEFSIDRSLNTEKFFNATQYRAPDWLELIEIMHKDYLSGK